MIYAATASMVELFKPWLPGIKVVGNVVLPDDAKLLVLTGGVDVNPARYGEENTASDSPSILRDEIEFRLVEEAIIRNIPIFGVCRGLQVLNVAMGGTLYQDLYEVGKSHYYSHPIVWNCDRFPSIEYVNSLHHQAIKNVGDRFQHTVLGTESRTGVIEAIEWRNGDHEMFAVQFHPEMADVLGATVFKYVKEKFL